MEGCWGFGWKWVFDTAAHRIIGCKGRGFYPWRLGELEDAAEAAGVCGGVYGRASSALAMACSSL